MDITAIENDKQRLKIQIGGEGHTFCNVLKKELWQDKSIAIAGYSIEHSLTSDPVLTLEVSKGDAKKTLLDAVARLKTAAKTIKEKTKAL